MRKPTALTFATLAPLAFARQASPPAGTAATVEVKATADTIRRNDSASRTVLTHDDLVKFGDRSALDGFVLACRLEREQAKEAA